MGCFGKFLIGIKQIKFYKKYNSNISSEWLNGKLTKNDIEKINWIPCMEYS